MPIGFGREIKFYEAAWLCDECGEEQLKYTGIDCTENGAKTFEHECPKCKELAYLNRIYPALLNDPFKVLGEPVEARSDGKKSKKKGRRRKRAKPKGK